MGKNRAKINIKDIVKAITKDGIPMTMSFKNVLEARARITGLIHTTPVMQSSLLNEIAGARLFFKCEHLQKVGAFKARGAVNAVFALTDAEAAAGVATHSSGNHGAALARAAKLRGVPAWIVVPDNALAAKKAAIKAYGAEIVECDATLQAREATLQRLVAKRRCQIVAPYDDELVIAGQGTAGLELSEQVADLECIVTPVGGGGLLAGCLLAMDGRIPVYGAEPAGADDAYRSFRAGKRIESHVPNTIADGLRTVLGVINFDIIKSSAADILLVNETEIVEAMGLIWTRLKQVVEPSSAVTLAAVLKNPGLFSGKRVGLILTGGNVDIEHLPF
ncbi:MAG: threonine dehydratase [Candidatus Azotimanducaceae bacterium]